MNQTLNEILETNSLLRINNKKFSNEVIFEQVFKDGDLNGIDVFNCNFDKTDFNYCDFYSCNFKNCNFNGGLGLSLWRKCNFYDCNFENCKLSNYDWSRVDFNSTLFINCNFQNLNLKSSNLYKCKLIKANWNKIYFEDTDFSDLEIQETTFIDLDFSQIFPMLICNKKLEKYIKVSDSQTFNKAIKLNK